MTNGILSQATHNESWQLIECRDDDRSPRVLVMSAVPTTVGRTADAVLSIPSSSISKRHAELVVESDAPIVRDLGSTNGTFVNGSRIQERALHDGDIVQFANTVFRVARSATAEDGATMEEGALPWAGALLQFEQLMSSGGVVPHFQPIVDIEDGRTIGYESLARSNLEQLRNPGVMFSTAAKLGQECALSVLLRREAASTALTMNEPGNIFLNTHPKEVIRPLLIDSLHELRRQAPSLRITIEIHEAAVVAQEEMREFRRVLDQVDMQLAYDDFGAGQARLDELAEVPPDFLKFDIKLIRNIDRAGDGRRELVRSLVQVVHQLGVQPLAEGVETEAEARTCRELGFTLAQGFFFGHPSPHNA